MPEIQELLERTTPGKPPGFDVADLVRRGRRRRQRTQVGTGLGAVALVAAAVAGLVLVTPDDEQGQVVASRPPTGELAEAFAASDVPLGTWEQVAQPPFSPRMGSFTGTASDGRVVVWGGTDEFEGKFELLTDGGVYNPDDGTWEAIPVAPVGGGDRFHLNQTQLADNRLMVFGTPDDLELTAAIYDLDSQRWTEIEPPPTIELPAEGIAWTGETLVLARLWSGAQVDRVASYTEPVVERWSYETGEWETGATPPLSNRFGANVGFDGERLGVWGGARQEVEIGALATGAELVGDGAIYDVAADRWEPMPAGPLPPMMQGTALWLESGRLAVAGGVVEDPSGSSPLGSGVTGKKLRPVGAAAVYEPGTRTWSSLAAPPSEPLDSEEGINYFTIDDLERPLLGVAPRQSGPQPVRVYDELTRAWTEVPLRDLHELDGTLIATSRTRGGPGDDPFGVQVQVGNVWEPATEAPFVNRMDAGVAVVGGDLLVVGGAEGPNLDIVGDAWLLRFPPSG